MNEIPNPGTDQLNVWGKNLENAELSKFFCGCMLAVHSR